MTVFKIEAEKVRRRADFFLSIASEMCAEPRLARIGFFLTETHALHLAEAYFLVNEAFKEHRQNDGHRTQPPKIAAISAAVIGTVNPLRPNTTPDGTVAHFVNPLYALRVASSILDYPIHELQWEQRMWFCNLLRSDPLACLDEYLNQTRNQARKIGDPFEITISREELGRLEGRFPLYYALTELAEKSR